MRRCYALLHLWRIRMSLAKAQTAETYHVGVEEAPSTTNG